MPLGEVCAGSSRSTSRPRRNLQSPLRRQKEQSHYHEESKPTGFPHLCYLLFSPITTFAIQAIQLYACTCMHAIHEKRPRTFDLRCFSCDDHYLIEQLVLQRCRSAAHAIPCEAAKRAFHETNRDAWFDNQP